MQFRGSTMLSCTLLLLLLTATVGSCPAVASEDVELLVQPARPRQGEVVLLTAVVQPGRWERIEGRFLDQELSFRPGRALGSYWALAGVPIDGPSSADLLLRAVAVDGRVRDLRRTVSVTASTTGAENLRVPRRMVVPPRSVLDRIARERKRVNRVMAGRFPSSWFGSFQPPVLASISSPFGRRRFFNGIPKGRHWGVDLRAMTGTPVHSTQDGVVSLVGDLYYTGGTVIVDHGDGLRSLYCHLSRMDVREGQRVRRGDVVGAVGATGRVTGAHLHWEMRLGKVRLAPFSFCRLPLDPVAD